MRAVTLIVIITSGIVASPAHAQSRFVEEGRPFYVQRFTASDYRQHEQNWGITQDYRGVIFVANRMGVLEYDGTSWRSHTIPNTFTRSIAAVSDGSVCVGGVGEIGCFLPSESGSLEYRSLTNEVPEAEREFMDVWTTIALPDGVYFQTFSHIFRWDGETLTSWSASGRFHKAFEAHGRYYVREEGTGLQTLADGRLVTVPGGERFAEERIDALVPHGDERLLIVARESGMLIWEQGDLRVFGSDASRYLRERRIYHGIPLQAEMFAFATVHGSVVVLDADGRLVTRIAQNVGLQPEEMVLDVIEDHQGGLWLALDTGILRVDAPSPITYFGVDRGLEGAVSDITRIDGRLFVATTRRLLTLDTGPASDITAEAHFANVAEIEGQVFRILQSPSGLLVATSSGVSEIIDGRVNRVLDEVAFDLTASDHIPGAVYVGLKSGVSLMRSTATGWTIEPLLSGDRVGEVRGVREDRDGVIWISSLTHGLLRANIENGDVVRLAQVRSQQASVEVRGLFEFEDAVFVLASDGIYQATNGLQPTLARDPSYDQIIDFTDEAGYLVNVSPGGDLWVLTRGSLRKYRRTSDGFDDITPTSMRLDGLPTRVLVNDREGVIWIATEQGLLRYDPAREKEYVAPYSALVRRVLVDGRGPIYRGAGLIRYAAPELRFVDNSLRFEVAATSYNEPESTVFQFWLEGFDRGWSEWTSERFKEYTNLPEGQYRFHVRARNVHGTVSEVGTFPFRVLPPWYRTWWAYLSYLSLGGLIVWGYGRWRLREHMREMERERRIRLELEVANARLTEANERLHEADRLKDDVLANLSHELRTPLTSILGFASVLHEDLDGQMREFADHIKSGGERLLRTVDSLLDMARLQADAMQLDPVDLDLAAAVRDIVRGLAPAANQKGLFLKVLPADFALPARTDPAAIDRIVTNLVSNAIKFTQDGGVTVLIDGDDDSVFITVKDTGIGIEPAFLPELFGTFKQASSGYQRAYEGSGIGLAVTKRMVDLLGGGIEVTSNEGQGTVFRVRLPRFVEGRPPSRDAALKTVRLHNRRLLLVVDADRPEYALRSALQDLAPTSIVNGIDEAREALRGEHYDLVLVDGHIDTLQARENVSALRSEPGAESAAFVAITAATMPGDRDRFRALGFDDHIGKPYTRARILTTLEALVRQPQAV